MIDHIVCWVHLIVLADGIIGQCKKSVSLLAASCCTSYSLYKPGDRHDIGNYRINITNIILTGIQVRSITSDISGRVGNVLRGMARGGLRPTATGFMFEETVGRSAGDGITGFGLWSSYAYSDFKDDLVSTAFSGDRHSVLGGFDISPWDSTLLGIAVGYETNAIKTGFNNGRMDSDGFTVAPYFGALLTDSVSVDVSMGYSRISVDQFRTDPDTGDRITSRPASSSTWSAT
jgi:hypothetical protein